MKTLFKIALVLLFLFVCATLGEIFGGVIGAVAAAFLHASPYVTMVLVRVFTTLFFFGFLLLAWVIYSRRRESKARRRLNELKRQNDGPKPQ